MPLAVRPVRENCVAPGRRRMLGWHVIAFEPSSLAAGLGAVWAADERWPVVVRIDPATRRGARGCWP